jgi:flagellar basal body P-ring protein FlgI
LVLVNVVAFAGLVRTLIGVKDLATLAAQRPNQLIGFGLVVGLQGTG